MDLRAQSAFLAALVVVVLAVVVALRATERRHARLFAVLAGNLGVWQFADFLTQTTGAEGFLRLWLATGALLPATGHRFYQALLASHAVPGEAGVREVLSAERLGRVLWGGAALGAGLALTPLVHRGWFLAAELAYVMVAYAAVLQHVYRHRARTRSRIERTRITYVSVGGAIALGFALAGFLPGLSGLWTAVGNAGVALYFFFLSQAILRHRLLDLNELLGKLVVLAGLGATLVVVFAVIVVAFGGNTPLLLFNLLLASFILMTVFPALRARLERMVMAWLFAERYELTRALERLRREVPGLIDPVACAVRILDRLYETNRVTHASVYLLSEDATGFRLAASRGPVPPPAVEPAGVSDLVDAALSGQKAVLRETVERRLAETRRALERAGGEESRDPTVPDRRVRLERLQKALDRMNAGLTVPLVTGGRVVGLLNLRDERVVEAYATDEIAGILLVAELAATVVENSRAYRQMKERDRLAALGEMAAGLAHEIRNPLGAIKAAAQYLEPSDLPGDQGEFLGIIIEETDRLNGVVTQFLDYARPLKGAFVRTDLNELVKKTLRLLEHREIPAGIEVSTRLADGLPEVEADPEQLKQVLLNLVLNAVQAMEGRGRLEVATRHDAAPEGHRASEAVEVRVRDTGPGVPEAVRESLFIPFFTTKERGTGLGLPICQRIVQNHRGSLDLAPHAGPGAEFVIRLPVAAAPRAAEPGRPTASGAKVLRFPGARQTPV